MQARHQKVALITCSHGPDFARCQRMCESVDRWVSSEFSHLLIVPARDLDRFRSLENTRRSVLAVQDVVPAPFWQVPLSQRWWLNNRGWPVRGWSMQQVTKLSANFATDAEHLVFVDSDLQFINHFDRDTILDEGRLRLHRLAGAKRQGEHLKLHYRAANLLGVQQRDFGADFDGQLITWRRSHLPGLHARLEEVNEKPWYRSVAQSSRISEYILYGAYMEAVVGAQHSGHFVGAEDICHCCRFPDEAEALANGTGVSRKNAVAVLLQSNLGLSCEEERRILQRVSLPEPAPMEAFS